MSQLVVFDANQDEQAIDEGCIELEASYGGTEVVYATEDPFKE